jgi:hypothetical protein
MTKNLRRITVVSISGATEPRVVYTKSGKKKSSPWLAPVEHIEKHLLAAGQTYTDELARRHAKSNRRRRDGWILDAPKNVIKATTRAYRVYRKVAPLVLPK